MLASCSPTPDPDQIARDDLFVLSLPDMNPEESLHLFDYDRSVPLDIQEVERSDLGSITSYDITYASPKGGRVPAYLIVPEGKGPYAGIVLMHGGARSSSREDFWYTGMQYARYGAVVIIIDAPWNRPEYGPGLVPARFSTIPQTFTEYDREEQIQLIVDLRRAVDLLIERPDVDPERIAYIGVSYGGAMGGLLAGVEDRLQAYVLVVGDGGLVTHYSDPYELVIYPQGPFYRLSEEGREVWLEAMWPIEPIHFVDRAAPAALLFQNGTEDSAVPPFDSSRYQRAGSEPKKILWYDSGHDLPVQAELDRFEWLQQYIGSDNLFFLSPNFRTSAVSFDRLILIWFLATLVALGFVIWDLTRDSRGLWWIKLVWLFAIVIFGPLGLLAYLYSYQQSQEIEKPWRLALGSAIYSLVGYTIAFIIVLVLLLKVLPDNYPLARLALIYAVPFIIGLMAFRAPLLVSRMDSGYGSALSRSLFAEFTSANLAFAGMFPTAVFLFSRWFTFFDLDMSRGLFWIVLIFIAFAGLVLTYPINVWMARRGYTVWPGMSAGIEENVSVPTLRKDWIALLLSILLFVVALGLGLLVSVT